MSNANAANIAALKTALAAATTEVDTLVAGSVTQAQITATQAAVCSPVLDPAYALVVDPAAPPPPPPATAGFGQPVMALPVGTKGQYTLGQRIWQDTFSGTTLDPTHWCDIFGGPAPVGKWGGYTGTPVVNNGLTLSNTGAPSAVNTFNPNTQKYLFNFPPAGFYIQVNAKFTDMAHGFWPAIWFPTSNPAIAAKNQCEIDIFEGGMIGGGVTPGNDCWEGNFGGGSSEWPGFSYGFKNVGYDMTTRFTAFGCEYIPGVSCTLYVNGAVAHQTLQSNEGGIPGSGTGYNFVVTPQNGGGEGSWHTSGPGTGTIEVAEVQVYSLP